MLTFIFIAENYKPIAAKSNDIVAVYSTKNNGGIYRARVIVPGFDSTNMVKCSLIDIGHIDMISSKNIFSLPNYVSLNKVSRKYNNTINYLNG